MNSKQILEREFLELRAKVLQIAASLDRMDRAEGTIDADEKIELIRKGISILSSDEPNRAEQIQMLFSRAYDNSWQEQFEISARA